MSLSSLDKMFIRRWKAHDFSKWNESDVREDLIAPLLAHLGYAKGTLHDILREESVSLSQAYHRVGRKRIVIDYVPTVRLRSFWIIEAKPGAPREMDFGDFLQAHLYAVHPEIGAHYIVLCNGWELRVYESQTARSWDDTLLVCNQANCDEVFPELLNTLGRQSLTKRLRQRVLATLEESLASEIDVSAAASLRTEVNSIIRAATPVIDKNARELKSAAYKQAEAEEQQRISEADNKSLMIMMDIPTHGQLQVAREFSRRVIDAKPEEQNRMIDRLAMTYRGRPHAIFRVNSAFICCRLLQAGIHGEKSSYIQSVSGCLSELVSGATTYWGTHGLSNALCHLDNTTLRLARKFCIRFAMEPLIELSKARRKTLAMEDLLASRSSVAGDMIGMVGMVAEYFWRLYCSMSDIDEIWSGIWSLECIEEVLEKVPAPSYPKGEGDLLFFDSYGRGFDMLCVGTWDVVHHRLKGVASVPANVSALANMTRAQAIASIPVSRSRPKGWKPPEDALLAGLNKLQSQSG